MGVTADEDGRPGRSALLPSLHNPVRTSLKPVLIFSDNRPSDFVTVNADGVTVASKTDDIAWAENSPGLADAKMHAKWDSVVSKYPHTAVYLECSAGLEFFLRDGQGNISVLDWSHASAIFEAQTT